MQRDAPHQNARASQKPGTEKQKGKSAPKRYSEHDAAAKMSPSLGLSHGSIRRCCVGVLDTL